MPGGQVLSLHEHDVDGLGDQLASGRLITTEPSTLALPVVVRHELLRLGTR